MSKLPYSNSNTDVIEMLMSANNIEKLKLLVIRICFMFSIERPLDRIPWKSELPEITNYVARITDLRDKGKPKFRKNAVSIRIVLQQVVKDNHGSQS